MTLRRIGLSIAVNHPDFAKKMTKKREEGKTYRNSLRPLLLPSFPPPLTILTLREQWFNPDVLNKHPYMYIISSCPQTIREFLHILTLFLYLSLLFQRQLIQLHVKCLSLTFRFNSMFPWCTILLCSSSVKSCRFFLCLIYCKAHWLFIRFSQNVHRKSDLLHEEKVKLSSITALPYQGDT